jgi:DNA-3-methyladenine glycosylase I
MSNKNKEEFNVVMENDRIRCKWCNVKNKLYIEYHDKEWGIKNFDDGYLYEMLILESFQAGLSWECILNKRKEFRKAFDNFDINKIINYDEKKINELLENDGIIRNRLKINSTINNSKIFKDIQKEYGTFYNYLKTFTKDKIIYEIGKTKSELSDNISKDLQQRGMKFVGTTIIYSYLQAIGVIYSHDKECFMYKDKYK